MNDMKQKDDTTMKLLSRELDEARELARELRDALSALLAADYKLTRVDAKNALTKAKEVLGEA